MPTAFFPSKIIFSTKDSVNTLRFFLLLAGFKKYFDALNYKPLASRSALVTAGPTREMIDPVRFISNESSGKQGYAIAETLQSLGAKTTLVSGPTKIIYDNDVKVKRVVSADEMFRAVKKMLPTHIAVCAAAVSDFKPFLIKKNKATPLLKNEVKT